jgi:hypothetical protein
MDDREGKARMLQQKFAPYAATLRPAFPSTLWREDRRRSFAASPNRISSVVLVHSSPLGSRVGAAALLQRKCPRHPRRFKLIPFETPKAQPSDWLQMKPGLPSSLPPGACSHSLPGSLSMLKPMVKFLFVYSRNLMSSK